MRLKISDMWDFSNPQNCEKNFREKMEKHSDSAFEVWELQTQVARALGLQGKFIQAFKILDSIQAGLEFAPTCVSKDLVGIRYNLEMGRLLMLNDKPEDSIRYFKFALKLALNIEAEDLSMDAINMLVSVVSINERIEFGLKGIDLATKSDNGELKSSIGNLAIEIGESYLQVQEYQKAIEQFMHACDIFSKAFDAEKVRYIRLSICIAQRALGLHKEALLELRAQEEWHKKSGTNDAIVFEEIAENLLALGHSSSSIYFSKTLKYFEAESMIGKKGPERLARIKQLARKILN
tara:strand:+ start:4846 stop:5724 length:879 start_codon:yes stop_codon:yes gene_type:complete